MYSRREVAEQLSSLLYLRDHDPGVSKKTRAWLAEQIRRKTDELDKAVEYWETYPAGHPGPTSNTALPPLLPGMAR